MINKNYYQSNKWKEIRRLKLKYNSWCEECKSKKHLQVHHKKYTEEEKLEDLQVLCKRCHFIHHSYESKPFKSCKKCEDRLSAWGTWGLCKECYNLESYEKRKLKEQREENFLDLLSSFARRFRLKVIDKELLDHRKKKKQIKKLQRKERLNSS